MAHCSWPSVVIHGHSVTLNFVVFRFSFIPRWIRNSFTSPRLSSMATHFSLHKKSFPNFILVFIVATPSNRFFMWQKYKTQNGTYAKVILWSFRISFFWIQSFFSSLLCRRSLLLPRKNSNLQFSLYDFLISWPIDGVMSRCLVDWMIFGWQQTGELTRFNSHRIDLCVTRQHHRHMLMISVLRGAHKQSKWSYLRSMFLASRRRQRSKNIRKFPKNSWNRLKPIVFAQPNLHAID